MKLMTSKFPGKCRDCGESIQRGQSIAYHGRGLGVSCADCAEIDPEDIPQEDDSAGLERGTLANDRRMARNGLTVVRTSSGWSGSRNSRGRCEDAPCCGCCTY